MPACKYTKGAGVKSPSSPAHREPRSRAPLLPPSHVGAAVPSPAPRRKHKAWRAHRLKQRVLLRAGPQAACSPSLTQLLLLTPRLVPLFVLSVSVCPDLPFFSPSFLFPQRLLLALPPLSPCLIQTVSTISSICLLQVAFRQPQGMCLLFSSSPADSLALWTESSTGFWRSQ